MSTNVAASFGSYPHPFCGSRATRIRMYPSASQSEHRTVSSTRPFTGNEASNSRPDLIGRGTNARTAAAPINPTTRELQVVAGAFERRAGEPQPGGTPGPQLPNRRAAAGGACDVDEIALFRAGSDLHIKHKLAMTREQVKEAAVRETEYAVAHGVDVSFVTEDTFRADLDFVVDLYDACTAAGSHRAVVCDTVGVMTPPGITWFFEQLKRRLKPTELSFHGHNDFGLAVANSLAAVEAGVALPHTCVNCLADRSGNASFEELVLSLEALYGYDTGIDISRIYELSQLVETLSGIPVGMHQPLVGHNAFAHESGIHAHGVIKHTATYEPMQPEKLGRQRTFVFGKHTGSLAVSEKLRGHRVEATPEQVAALVKVIKDFAEARSKGDQQAFIVSFRDRAERRRGVTDDEFWTLAQKAELGRPQTAAK